MKAWVCDNCDAVLTDPVDVRIEVVAIRSHDGRKGFVQKTLRDLGVSCGCAEKREEEIRTLRRNE